MANRRMFAKTIVNSGRFLQMPATARLLYYDLGMAADDDGFVEAYAVMETTGAREDDLRVLAAKDYIKIMNEDLVSLITDWKINNYIQNDRHTASVYIKLLDQSVSKMDTMYTKCIQDGYNVSKMGVKAVDNQPSSVDNPSLACAHTQNVLLLDNTCKDTDNFVGSEKSDGKGDVRETIERDNIIGVAGEEKKGEEKERAKREGVEEGYYLSERFKAPTLDELKAYASEKGYTFDVQYFLDYWTSVGWRRGKFHVKDWKATMRTWNSNQKRYEKERVRKEHSANFYTDGLTPEEINAKYGF